MLSSDSAVPFEPLDTAQTVMLVVAWGLALTAGILARSWGVFLFVMFLCSKPIAGYSMGKGIGLVLGFALAVAVFASVVGSTGRGNGSGN